MKVLVLTRYGSMGASSRMRTLQYLPWLESASWTYDAAPFFTDRKLKERYRTGSYEFAAVCGAYFHRIVRMTRRDRYDLIWIEKEALPWLPVSVERWLLGGVPYVLDYDDAVFHNYDLHRIAFVRQLFGRRLDKLMAGASLVVAGNRYLAKRAVGAGAVRVEIVPTVIDLLRYRALARSPVAVPRIVWIGSPSTVRYLQLVRDPLAALSKEVSFTLRVIGGESFEIPGVKVETLPWSAETEAAAIQECDIGIMPLEDSPWEKGKCAYKLIQYMACGLPTVASPVGANVDVVIDGETGYLANDAATWVQQLKRLLLDPDLRMRMGACGRARVEQHYCIQQTAPRLIKLLSDVVQTSR